MKLFVLENTTLLLGEHVETKSVCAWKTEGRSSRRNNGGPLNYSVPKRFKQHPLS